MVVASLEVEEDGSVCVCVSVCVYIFLLGKYLFIIQYIQIIARENVPETSSVCVVVAVAESRMEFQGSDL